MGGRRPIPVTALVRVLGSLLLMALLAGCPNRTDRIVDCAPGYHNQAGPSSDCAPGYHNQAGPSSDCTPNSPPGPVTGPS